ncbi:vWA domain-containing protein [Catenulispora subtropica]|uniref:VWFA domain-containing protein n=1 Tax=Catenulispora subtropica TaxID=450798 RepID=A0ABN2SHI3_9ACTN
MTTGPEEMDIPGGPMTKRSVNFYWLLDCSGSMSVNGKMAALNTAIREAVPELRSVAQGYPAAQLLIRTVRFSERADWHGPGATAIETYVWNDLVAAGGSTAMGSAFKLVADEFQSPTMPSRAMRPVLVLVSDGQPTDDWRSGLRAIEATDWGRKAVRVAVAIGDDADRQMMQEFVNDPELPVLRAQNGKQIAAAIRWASTNALNMASSGSGSPSPGAGTSRGGGAASTTFGAAPTVTRTRTRFPFGAGSAQPHGNILDDDPDFFD